MAILALLAPELPARTRKGDRFLREGRKAEVRKDFDQALDLYERALNEDPEDPAYLMAVMRTRPSAARMHVERGRTLREDGQLAEALAEFERAYAIDPSSSSMAEQEIRATRQMLERERKAREKDPDAKPEAADLDPMRETQRKTAELIGRMRTMPELKPLSTQPITLKMNNQQPKVMFETLGKLAGISVLLDPDFAQSGRPMSVELTNATVEEALDHLCVLTRSFWKPVSASAIFVTQDNATKRRDFEEQVMRVFYLTNVNTPQELQEIATTVRSICDIRRLFVYNAQMAIVVRAEADRVALAEKLLADLDKPKSEVVIDVLVMEYNRSRDRNLALSAAPNGIDTPVVYGRVTSTEEGGDTGGGARVVTAGGYSVVLPVGRIRAVLSDRNTRVLQSPQVRAADSFKASLRIGDKVPTASGSFQPGIGGVGINPLVNTQFQFIDVGVNVDITPKIHYPNEVSLKVEVDMSNVRERIDLGGIEQPIIGQRKVNFEVRLREGEANVLGGLVQLQESKTVSGVPFLAAIPIVGRLFSSETITKAESELLFVLIPHIVRTPEIHRRKPAADRRGQATRS
ncbi:MAG: tetratricopeptide repeat protein [Bryobacterales bacterium]|nr:tetratricopeptide repeat protein [Bryobacterales bacterium]